MLILFFKDNWVIQESELEKKIRTIKNVPHDLLGVVKDLKNLVVISRLRIQSASDLIKHMKEAEKCVFLIERYLNLLDQEATKYGIEKAKVQPFDLTSKNDTFN